MLQAVLLRGALDRKVVPLDLQVLGQLAFVQFQVAFQLLGEPAPTDRGRRPQPQQQWFPDRLRILRLPDPLDEGGAAAGSTSYSLRCPRLGGCGSERINPDCSSRPSSR